MLLEGSPLLATQPDKFRHLDVVPLICWRRRQRFDTNFGIPIVRSCPVGATIRYARAIFAVVSSRCDRDQSARFLCQARGPDLLLRKRQAEGVFRARQAAC